MSTRAGNEPPDGPIASDSLEWLVNKARARPSGVPDGLALSVLDGKRVNACWERTTCGLVAFDYLVRYM